MKDAKLSELSNEAREQPSFEVRLDSKPSSTIQLCDLETAGLLSLSLCSVIDKKGIMVTPVPECEQVPAQMGGRAHEDRSCSCWVKVLQTDLPHGGKEGMPTNSADKMLTLP